MSPPSSTKHELHFRMAGLAGKALIRSLFLTCRVRREGTENFLRFRREGMPVVFAFWHGQMLPLVHRHRNEGVVVLVSEHADGEYITRIIERHGFGTARGSSTRSGVKGLKGIVQATRLGRDVAFTADGPRGPRHELKWGVLTAAQLTGAPLIPVALAASRAWTLKSWDRFVIPKPFSTVRIGYGEPFWIPRDADESALAGYAASLQETLIRMTERLESQVRGAEPTAPDRATWAPTSTDPNPSDEAPSAPATEGREERG